MNTRGTSKRKHDDEQVSSEVKSGKKRGRNRISESSLPSDYAPEIETDPNTNEVKEYRYCGNKRVQKGTKEHKEENRKSNERVKKNRTNKKEAVKARKKEIAELKIEKSELIKRINELTKDVAQLENV